MAGRRDSGSSKVSSSPYTAPQAPVVAHSGAGRESGPHPIGQPRLCGYISQMIGGAVGKDVLVRDLEDRKSRPFVEPAPDLRLPDLQHALTEGVVVPVPALEGAVIGVALIVIAAVIAVHTIVEPLYHASSEASPHSPIWSIN